MTFEQLLKRTQLLERTFHPDAPRIPDDEARELLREMIREHPELLMNDDDDEGMAQ